MGTAGPRDPAVFGHPTDETRTGAPERPPATLGGRRARAGRPRRGRRPRGRPAGSFVGRSGGLVRSRRSSVPRVRSPAGSLPPTIVSNITTVASAMHGHRVNSVWPELEL